MTKTEQKKIIALVSDWRSVVQKERNDVSRLFEFLPEGIIRRAYGHADGMSRCARELESLLDILPGNPRGPR